MFISQLFGNGILKTGHQWLYISINQWSYNNLHGQLASILPHLPTLFQMDFKNIYSMITSKRRVVSIRRAITFSIWSISWVMAIRILIIVISTLVTVLVFVLVLVHF